MKILLVVFAVLCTASSAWAQPRNIYVTNESTAVTDAEIQAALPAFQAQIDEDIGDVWNVNARLVFDTPPPLGWRITVTDNPPCWFCGGLHHWLDGRAEALVRPGDDWQLSFSHELVEMLVDPYIRDDGNWGRFVKAGKRLWLVETGDPVEDSKWSYERDGVTLSDFVLPAWYRGGAKGPYDFQGYVDHPFQILEGGYAWYISAGRWVQK